MLRVQISPSPPKALEQSGAYFYGKMRNNGLFAMFFNHSAFAF
nr:MAG TPA: hypothetical protein [Bacteriophage sp.]